MFWQKNFLFAIYTLQIAYFQDFPFVSYRAHIEHIDIPKCCKYPPFRAFGWVYKNVLFLRQVLKRREPLYIVPCPLVLKYCGFRHRHRDFLYLYYFLFFLCVYAATFLTFTRKTRMCAKTNKKENYTCRPYSII